jgi:hypothetical protein
MDQYGYVRIAGRVYKESIKQIVPLVQSFRNSFNILRAEHVVERLIAESALFTDNQ